MSLITVDNWKTNTDIDFEGLNISDEKIEQKITYAQGLVETFVGQTVASGYYQERGRCRFNAENRIFFRTQVRPIISFESFSLTQVVDITYLPDQLEIDYLSGYIRTLYPVNINTFTTLEGRLFGGRRDIPIIIRYTGGYDPIPQPILTAMYRATDYVFSTDRQLASKMRNDSGRELASFSLGDLSESYVTTDSISPNERNRSILPQYIQELLSPYVNSYGAGVAGVY